MDLSEGHKGSKPLESIKNHEQEKSVDKHVVKENKEEFENNSDDSFTNLFKCFSCHISFKKYAEWNRHAIKEHPY